MTLDPQAWVMIGVPGSFDGVELVRRVRQTARTKHAPIMVLLTACVFESDRQRAFAAGCDLFLPKHSPPERLVSEIRLVGATEPERQMSSWTNHIEDEARKS